MVTFLDMNQNNLCSRFYPAVFSNDMHLWELFS